MENIKVILFDVDGTLIDTDDLIINSYRELFRRFRPDYKLTREEEIGFLGPTLASMFPRYFKEDFQLLFQVYRNYSHEHMREYSFVYDYAIEVIEHLKLKGYRLGVVTSRFKSSVMSVLEEFDLTKYFEIIVSLDDVNTPKPDPEGINKCLSYFNVEPQECLYIGDNLNDYKAAISANVKTALVSWARGRDNSLLKPDILLKTYLDLKKIFN